MFFQLSPSRLPSFVPADSKKLNNVTCKSQPAQGTSGTLPIVLLLVLFTRNGVIRNFHFR